MVLMLADSRVVFVCMCIFRMSKVKRRQWLNENMLMAMNDVKEGKLTAYAAAKKYDVPRRTLDDRLKGRVQHGTNPGPLTVLTKEEEASLVAYLLHMAQHGFPLTPTMTKAFAWAIAICYGKGDRFSEVGLSMHWWTNFRRRHPELTLRKMDNLERSRAECLTPEVVNDHFNLLEKILSESSSDLGKYIIVMKLSCHLTKLRSCNNKKGEICVLSVTGHYRTHNLVVCWVGFRCSSTPHDCIPSGVS